MKKSAIYMNQWLGASGRKRPQDTDNWYLGFLNRLLPVLKKAPLYAGTDGIVRVTRSALALALYLQDCIAQSGGWRMFSDRYRALYGAPLPFYRTTDEYLPDEVNREDVAFVLWSRMARPWSTEWKHFTICDPFRPELLALADDICRMMEACFEEAPIADLPSPEGWVMKPDGLKPLSPLPEVTSQTRLISDVERALAYSGGTPLLYFATYGELCCFFTDVLKWDNRPDSLMPDLKDSKEFVVYANAKGLLLAPDVAACFRSTDNPCYDAGRAAAEGYKLFCQPCACPPDLLRYAMTYGLLPDVQLPFPGGKEVLQQHWEFVMRYYLGEWLEE